MKNMNLSPHWVATLHAYAEGGGEVKAERVREKGATDLAWLDGSIRIFFHCPNPKKCLRESEKVIV